MSSLDEYYKGGPKTTAEAFPPICQRTHWDPTSMTHHILPSMPLVKHLALDPRPSSKICTTYYNSSAGDSPLSNPAVEAPIEVPASLRGGNNNSHSSHSSRETSIVYPPGGAAGLGFPYTAYNPDQESELNLLSRGLTKCAEGRYTPKAYAPANNAVEGVSQGFATRALDVRKEAGCRGADDDAAWNRSSRMFMNPTRYDRTTGVPAKQPDNASLCNKL